MTTRTLYFLAASDATPLAKHYALRNGVLEKSSYPNIYNFDSHAESIRSLPELYRAITEHAALGHCLLKGELQRPLRHESRAGSTNTYTPTSWVALDFDGVPGITSFEELVPAPARRIQSAELRRAIQRILRHRTRQGLLRPRVHAPRGRSPPDTAQGMADCI